MKLFDLNGEIAVVIGATGTLGGAIAEGLAQAGAKVAVVGRNEANGLACVQRIEKAGGKARFFSADATNLHSITQMVDSVEALLGPIGILVNAAGGNNPKVTVTPEHPVESIRLEDWNASFDLNLVGGVLLPCQTVGPRMVSRGKGSIINIASMSGHVALSRVVAYSAAKAAVINLTQFLAREWAPKGVRVNSISPGFFPAEQNRRLLFDEKGEPTARAKSILGHTPAGRFGEPHELVGSAVFLAASAASSFITGVDLRVDGGYLSMTI